MNFGDLLDYVGNLLDYDPTNPVYTEQLTEILNKSQTRVLTDRQWSFSQREETLKVFTDVSETVTLAQGSSTATGSGLPVSTSAVKPGSFYDRGVMEVTLASGTVVEYRIAWVENATTMHLTTPFEGPNGSYDVTIKFREVYLPSNTMTVMSVRDPVQGVPVEALFLSKFERDESRLDTDALGTIEAYIPSEGQVIPAPRLPTGVAVATPGAGRGVRTIKLYMVNVYAPDGANFDNYRADVSNGFESALSQVGTYELADNEDLTLTPETLPDETGLYRRYYFTCEEAGIDAPIRARDDGAGNAGQDTISPAGGVTITLDTSLSTLQTQAFRSTAVRYKWDHQGVHQSIQLYEHPSADQNLLVRILANPEKMIERQDTPIIPASYAQVIAYMALETLILKVDNPALAQVYERKRATAYKGMEARFLGKPSRRIIKGSPATQQRFFPNIYGPLTFTP